MGDINITLSPDARNIITVSSLCSLLLLSPLSRHPVLSVLPLATRLSLATMFSGPAILILSARPSRSLTLSSPLCQSVTLPPRVDWIHLTGYTAYDITALWCMAERVVALRHHNLTSATERNGTRAWHCSPRSCVHARLAISGNFAGNVFAKPLCADKRKRRFESQNWADVTDAALRSLL